jgi:hypothetical protein
MLRHSDTLDKTYERRAAAQEHVLTVVDFVSVDLERRRPAAQQTTALEKLDVSAGSFQLESGRQPGQAGTNDDYATPSHACSIT